MLNMSVNLIIGKLLKFDASFVSVVWHGGVVPPHTGEEPRKGTPGRHNGGCAPSRSA
jgi:hypothetical protein